MNVNKQSLKYTCDSAGLAVPENMRSRVSCLLEKLFSKLDLEAKKLGKDCSLGLRTDRQPLSTLSGSIRLRLYKLTCIFNNWRKKKLEIRDKGIKRNWPLQCFVGAGSEVPWRQKLESEVKKQMKWTIEVGRTPWLSTEKRWLGFLLWRKLELHYCCIRK